MRNTLHLLRNIMNDRSHSSGPPSPRLWLLLTAFSPPIVLRNVVGVGAAVYGYEWVNVRGRTMYENWKGEKKMLEVQEKLDREKHESPEAFLETVEREIEDLEPKLSKRKVRSCEVENYEREVALLKSKVLAWTRKEDTEVRSGQQTKLAG